MPAGEGGVGLKNLVMRREGEGAGAEVVGGGAVERGRWDVEHVPDREGFFWGWGFWLKRVRRVPF